MIISAILRHVHLDHTVLVMVTAIYVTAYMPVMVRRGKVFALFLVQWLRLRLLRLPLVQLLIPLLCHRLQLQVLRYLQDSLLDSLLDNLHLTLRRNRQDFRPAL